MKGRIKIFKEEKNFGFIQPEGGGEDLFFHKSEVTQGGYDIEEGAPVKFERSYNSERKKYYAIKVEILGFPEDKVSSPDTDLLQESAGLPREFIFETFFGKKGRLKQEIFYGGVPEKVAAAFQKAGLTSGQFRQLYQGLQAIISPLRLGHIEFEEACERFGIFYVERVVRQANRRVVPLLVKEFVDAHRKVATSGPGEMKGFFRYFANVYCYFSESGKRN